MLPSRLKQGWGAKEGINDCKHNCRSQPQPHKKEFVVYHSAIGNIRAYTLTIQCTNDPVRVIIACNKIKEAAEEIKKAVEEMEGKEARASF